MAITGLMIGFDWKIDSEPLRSARTGRSAHITTNGFAPRRQLLVNGENGRTDGEMPARFYAVIVVEDINLER